MHVTRQQEAITSQCHNPETGSFWRVHRSYKKKETIIIIIVIQTIWRTWKSNHIGFHMIVQHLASSFFFLSGRELCCCCCCCCCCFVDDLTCCFFLVSLGRRRSGWCLFGWILVDVIVQRLDGNDEMHAVSCCFGARMTDSPLPRWQANPTSLVWKISCQQSTYVVRVMYLLVRCMLVTVKQKKIFNYFIIYSYSYYTVKTVVPVTILLTVVPVKILSIIART
jgi:hypothetical protein